MNSPSEAKLSFRGFAVPEEISAASGSTEGSTFGCGRQGQGEGWDEDSESGSMPIEQWKQNPKISFH